MLIAITTCILLGGPPATHLKRPPLSDSALLRLVIPEYEKKLSRTKEPARISDPQCVYDATIHKTIRTNLGVPGNDLLVAVVHEVDYECTGCHSAILAVIDLQKRRVAFSHRVQGAIPDTVWLEKGSSAPWPIFITFGVSANHMEPGGRLETTSRLTEEGQLLFTAGPVIIESPR